MPDRQMLNNVPEQGRPNELVFSAATALLQLTPISGSECRIGYGDAPHSKAAHKSPKTQQSYTPYRAQYLAQGRAIRLSCIP